MSSFLTRLINERLDRLVDTRVKEFTERFATQPDGTRDEALAARIDYEMHRRAMLGRELDIYEPLRWAGISAALSLAAGVAVKLGVEGECRKTGLKVLAASTALNSAIQVVRLLPRYDAGLKGGADTAMAMHAFSEGCPPGEWERRIRGESRGASTPRL